MAQKEESVLNYMEDGCNTRKQCKLSTQSILVAAASITQRNDADECGNKGVAAGTLATFVLVIVGMTSTATRRPPKIEFISKRLSKRRKNFSE